MLKIARQPHAVLRLGIWLLIPLSLACASHQTVTGEKCALRDEDAVFALTGAVYRDCAVDRPAKLSTRSIHPDWTPTPGRTDCYSVDMEFVVDTTGKPETATARAAKTNDRAFADAYLATLNQWKYEPAQRAGAKVRQIVTEHRSAETRKVPFVAVVPGSPPPTRPPPSPGPAC